MCDIDYSIYTNFIKSIIVNNDLSYFKSDSRYTYMLEHVNETQGAEYLNCIKNNTSISIDDILTFCNLNDRQGNPKKVDFGIVTTSPTSLRYIWHAHLILSYFQKFNKESYNIVEIGGGYGGLCFAIYYFSSLYNIKLSSYTIVDLDEPLQLQKVYLQNLSINIPLHFVSASTYGKYITNNDLYLISNYCFSEVNKEHRTQYIEHLFPKVSHGFIAWNYIPIYNFGINATIEEEVPNTGPLNKYVYF